MHFDILVEPPIYFIIWLSNQEENGHTVSDNKTETTATNDGGKTIQTLVLDQQEESMIAREVPMKDPSFMVSSTSRTRLNDFMSRPIRIHEFQWLVSSTLNTVIYPFHLFFNNTTVRRKLANYALFRCDLKLRILINGTPFHYGKLMVSWHALKAYDSTNSVAHPATGVDLIKRSQRINVVLDPTSNQSGDLTLPYVYPTPWLKTPTMVSDSTLTNIGGLNLDQMSPLKHANGGTDPVNVAILAWAEDLEVCHPTTWIMQSDGQRQESKQGVVSSLATNAASFAKKAGTLFPAIEPYAIATETVAKGISSVARAFGFSRPINLETPHVYQPRFVGNLCNTDQNENCVRLSVDSKNELTIDPRVVGVVPQDELNIAHIAAIESFIYQFTWQKSDVSDTLLFSSRVCPSLFHLQPGPPATVYPTPLMFLNRLFNAWRGSLVFKVQVVCSAFHKGRLLLAYDPLTFTGAGGAPVDKFNCTYSQVLDLSETSELEFKIPFVSDTQFKRCQHVAVNSTSMNMSDTAHMTEADFSIGEFAIFVVNDLVTPDSVVNNDVTINIYVHMEDAHFANPSSKFKFDSLYGIQSSVVTGGTVTTTERHIKDLTPDFFKVNFGEQVLSLRTLLRRYCLHSGDSFETGTGDDLLMPHYIRQMFPNYRGADPNGTDLAVGSVPMNYVNTTVLNYITPAFVTRRGGLRYKYKVSSTHGNELIGYMEVQRRPDDALGFSAGTTVLAPSAPTSFSNRRKATILASSMIAGGHIINLGNKTTMEVDYPSYNHKRFYIGTNLNVNSGLSVDSSDYDAVNETFIVDASSTLVMYHRYVAAAEDYSLAFWNGAPAFQETALPAPL